MGKVMKNLLKDNEKKTSKDLAILIYTFLMEERYDISCIPKRTKELLDRATDCLETVYKIKFKNYVFLNVRHPLQEVFSIGYKPIKVKDRLKAEVHKKRGNTLFSDKSFKSAEIEYSKAIHLNPTNAVYWCNRSASRIRLESYFSAISDCKRALELDRSYAKALVWQGIAHALTDHPGRAISCYRRALRIEPGNEICIANIDIINKKLNRTAFRVLDPLCRYGRHFARIVIHMANNQDLFKWVKTDKDYDKEYRERQNYLKKLGHGALD